MRDQTKLMKANLELTVLSGMIDLAITELVAELVKIGKYQHQCKFRVNEVNRLSQKVNNNIIMYLEKFNEAAVVNHGSHSLYLVNCLKDGYVNSIDDIFWAKLIYKLTDSILVKSQEVKGSNFEYPFVFEIKGINRHILNQFEEVKISDQLDDLFENLELGIKIVKENEETN